MVVVEEEPRCAAAAPIAATTSSRGHRHHRGHHPGVASTRSGFHEATSTRSSHREATGGGGAEARGSRSCLPMLPLQDTPIAGHSSHRQNGENEGGVSNSEVMGETGEENENK